MRHRCSAACSVYWATKPSRVALQRTTQIVCVTVAEHTYATGSQRMGPTQHINPAGSGTWLTESSQEHTMISSGISYATASIAEHKPARIKSSTVSNDATHGIGIWMTLCSTCELLDLHGVSTNRTPEQIVHCTCGHFI